MIISYYYLKGECKIDRYLFNNAIQLANCYQGKKIRYLRRRIELAVNAVNQFLRIEYRCSRVKMEHENTSTVVNNSDYVKNIFNSEYYTHKFNAEYSKKVLPVSILFGLTASLGFIGNIFVVYIYGLKYKQCNFKYFLFVLGVIGTMQCCVMLPTQVGEMHYWFVFPTSWLCRVSAYVFSYSVILCLLVLLLISIDRYRKICRPYEWQIQSHTARQLCVLVSIISMVIAAPPGIVSGDHRYSTEYMGGNITVTVCATDDIYSDREWASYFLLIFGGAPVAVIIIVTCVLYGFILRQFYIGPVFPLKSLYKNERFSGVSSAQNSPQMTKRYGAGENIEMTSKNGYISTETDNNGNNRKTALQKMTDLIKRCVCWQTDRSEASTRPIRSSGSLTSKRETRVKLMRKTIIILIITVTCIIALISTFALHTIAEDINKNILSIPVAQLNAFVIIHRGSFSIICAIFPVVYGFRDARFRQAFLQIFGRGRDQRTVVMSGTQSEAVDDSRC